LLLLKLLLLLLLLHHHLLVVLLVGVGVVHSEVLERRNPAAEGHRLPVAGALGGELLLQDLFLPFPLQAVVIYVAAGRLGGAERGRVFSLH